MQITQLQKLALPI